jgi:hypothetical protein
MKNSNESLQSLLFYSFTAATCPRSYRKLIGTSNIVYSKFAELLEDIIPRGGDVYSASADNKIQLDTFPLFLFVTNRLSFLLRLIDWCL